MPSIQTYSLRGWANRINSAVVFFDDIADLDSALQLLSDGGYRNVLEFEVDLSFTRLEVRFETYDQANDYFHQYLDLLGEMKP